MNPSELGPRLQGEEITKFHLEALSMPKVSDIYLYILHSDCHVVHGCILNTYFLHKLEIHATNININLTNDQFLKMNLLHQKGCPKLMLDRLLDIWFDTIRGSISIK